MPSKLRTIKPMLATLKPRIATMRETRDRAYSADSTVRSWYKSTRWLKLRQKVLIRDSYTCQRTGEICSGKHPSPNSPVVNHRIPHKGSPDLFWDINNLETVTKAVHDSTIQREERNNL